MTGDKLLSQEEIDMLTGRHADLDDFQLDALGEIGNIGMGSAATAMSELTNQKVTITTPQVSIVSVDELGEEYPIPCVICRVTYLEGLQGDNLFIIKEDDAAVIVDLMMGGDGKNPPEKLDEMHISAIGEAMNQMMGSAATALSSMFDRMIGISPPTIDHVDLSVETVDFPDRDASGEDRLAQISFRMIIGDLVDSEIVEVIPLDFARDMVRTLTEGGGLAADDAREDGGADEWYDETGPQIPVTQIPHHQARNAGGFRPRADNVNIDLIKKIPVNVSVKLGSSVLSLDQVLSLGTGSVLKLDAPEGGPVEMLANGQLVARGQVVVVGERYGVRITEIANQAGRLESLKGA